MEIIPIKTRIIKPPKDSIYDIFESLNLKEKDVLCITSKIVAIHQGRTVCKSEVEDKDRLIKTESEVFIPREDCPGEHVIMTLKNHTLIPSAGIDESNANDHYILWPEKPEKEAKKICEFLKNKNKITKLGVIITDSHTTPLRWGVMGISVGFFGIEPLISHIGKKDLFGREIEMAKTNVVDSIASMAVYAMGEVNESTPMAIAREIPNLKFTEKETYKDLIIPKKEDIYYPLLERFYKKNE